MSCKLRTGVKTVRDQTSCRRAVSSAVIWRRSVMATWWRQMADHSKHELRMSVWRDVLTSCHVSSVCWGVPGVCGDAVGKPKSDERQLSAASQPTTPIRIRHLCRKQQCYFSRDGIAQAVLSVLAAIIISTLFDTAHDSKRHRFLLLVYWKYVHRLPGLFTNTSEHFHHCCWYFSLV